MFESFVFFIIGRNNPKVYKIIIIRDVIIRTFTELIFTKNNNYFNLKLNTSPKEPKTLILSILLYNIFDIVMSVFFLPWISLILQCNTLFFS